MKYNTYTVKLVIVVVSQIASAAHLRVHDDAVQLINNQTIANRLQAAATTMKDHLHSGSSGAQTSKLRVCNAVTTARSGDLTVRFNGKPLRGNSAKNSTGTGPFVIPQRRCVEFVVPISAKNKLEVHLTGQVNADWSSEKSAKEMKETPILFLVAHVFGTGAGTTFSVDSFHGENNGLNQVQVAYMDVLRGAPDAKVQLISPGGEFEMRGGTFMPICAGDYSLRFVAGGESVGKESATAHFAVGEQYIILRLASQNGGKSTSESVMVYPETDGSIFR